MTISTIHKRLAAIAVFALLILTAFCPTCHAQVGARKEVRIPDIPGYLTLRCDFHSHTVFSDGNVWPTVRIEEAWREGLDAIAITDHIEYQPHRADVPTKHNRPYELALPAAEALGILLIKGAEITRDLPDGHYNALFITDADALVREDLTEVLQAAADQGAFITWNHPGWPHPDEIARWYDVQTRLFEEGLFKGIEVVNNYSYYTDAHTWCLDKKLTMFGCSDVHQPIGMEYDFARGEHRPMTLVFAEERSPASIKEALFARRTVVYHENLLIGEAQYLEPLFRGSIEVLTPAVEIKQGRSANVFIRNDSDITFRLVAEGELGNLAFPNRLTIHAGSSVRLRLTAKRDAGAGVSEAALPYSVENLLVRPEEGLPVELKLKVTIAAAEN